MNTAFDNGWGILHDKLIVLLKLFGYFFFIESSVNQKQTFFDESFEIFFGECPPFFLRQLPQ